MELLEALVQGGVPPETLMPGTGCCALTDSVRLTAHAVKLGCGGALMLPPFYYKGVSRRGALPRFAEVIERVATSGCACTSITSPRWPRCRSASN